MKMVKRWLVWGSLVLALFVGAACFTEINYEGMLCFSNDDCGQYDDFVCSEKHAICCPKSEPDCCGPRGLACGPGPGEIPPDTLPPGVP